VCIPAHERRKRGTKSWYSLLLLFGHYNINDLSAFSYLSTTHLSDEPVLYWKSKLVRTNFVALAVKASILSVPAIARAQSVAFLSAISK